MEKKAITLKTLNKNNVWDIQENDVFRMLQKAENDVDIKENFNRYINIIRSAFEVEDLSTENNDALKKYEVRGYKTGTIQIDGNKEKKLAIKKRPIARVTDLTYENIKHITSTQLIEIIERNFSGGWESLSKNTQAIIESGFDISTTTLPTDRLHKPGGLYERKVKDGFEVLEISKLMWTEAIFVKKKAELPPSKIKNKTSDNEQTDLDDDDDNLMFEDYSQEQDEEDDTFDDDKLTEESYRTTYETAPDDLVEEAEEIGEDDDY